VAVVRAGGDVDSSLGGCELDRVREEVEDDLGHGSSTQSVGSGDRRLPWRGPGRWARLQALLPIKFALLVGALLVFVNIAPNTWQIRLRPRVWHCAFVGVAAAAAIMTISQPHPFIYFQF
jgi:hypothetical protein